MRNIENGSIILKLCTEACLGVFGKCCKSINFIELHHGFAVVRCPFTFAMLKISVLLWFSRASIILEFVLVLSWL